MKDIPYSVLKKDRRGFEILTLHDSYEHTFKEIADKYGISTIRARQIYNRMKVKQSRLYVRHISIALGYENTEKIGALFKTAYQCYQDTPYACAYLEQKYSLILDEYRAGEPGMSAQFVKRLPPLKRRLSQKTISRIVEMREKEGATFIAIGKEMRITPEKARHAYDWFYHDRVLEYVKARQKEAKSAEEAQAIWRRYSEPYRSSKKRYERIMEEEANR